MALAGDWADNGAYTSKIVAIPRPNVGWFWRDFSSRKCRRPVAVNRVFSSFREQSPCSSLPPRKGSPGCTSKEPPASRCVIRVSSLGVTRYSMAVLVVVVVQLVGAKNI